MSDNKKELEHSRETLRKMFLKNPELKKAFKETLDELSKPEEIDKMAKGICKGLKALSNLKVIR
jgi:ABC-type amino acid transport substrate-binding protein